MCCDAAIATVLTACTPNGARNSSGPERGGIRPRRPRLGAPSSPYVDCHTVRKHTTWRHSPAATASIAATSEPTAPGVSVPPLCHVGRIPSADSDRGHPAFAIAALGSRRRVRRQAVDVVHCQSGVGNGGADGLDGQRQRRDHQLAPDLRHADARNGDLVFELRRLCHRANRSDPVEFGALVWKLSIRLIGWFEERHPYVVDGLEGNTHAAYRRATHSGAQPTIFVVSRIRGSSSIATTATTNGAG